MMNRYVNARTAGVLLLSLLLLLLTGCARSPVLLESTKASLTPQTELTDVPFYAQTEYQCGPARFAVFVILLVTDILGLTDVYPFTR